MKNNLNCEDVSLEALKSETNRAHKEYAVLVLPHSWIRRAFADSLMEFIYKVANFFLGVLLPEALILKFILEREDTIAFFYSQHYYPVGWAIIIFWNMYMFIKYPITSAFLRKLSDRGEMYFASRRHFKMAERKYKTALNVSNKAQQSVREVNL